MVEKLERTCADRGHVETSRVGVALDPASLSGVVRQVEQLEQDRGFGDGRRDWKKTFLVSTRAPKGFEHD